MTDIKFDKRNYRIHNQKNKDLIKRSLEKYGAGRSILVDSEGEIIAGNGVYEQAKALNIPIREVETDGSELVVVVRKDLKTEDQARKELAVMDNSTSDSSDNNDDLLLEDFSREKLEELGVVVNIPDVDIDDTTYTTKINIPQYDVQGEAVGVNDLYDNEKQKSLEEKIEKSNLSEKEKEFLKYASYRHIVFNYHNIAEFYAKASKECQELMEESALVIIDYEDAIKNGYTTLSAKIQEVFQDD
jgi:hypothetical protein